MIVRGRHIQSNSRLLIYGTLRFSQVMQAILDHVPVFKDCIAYRCQRYKIKDQVHPALRLVPDMIAQKGFHICQGLTLADWERLDAYEDPRYELNFVDTNFGKVLSYSYTDHRFETDGAWDPKTFEERHLQDYVAMCRRFRERF